MAVSWNRAWRSQKVSPGIQPIDSNSQNIIPIRLLEAKEYKHLAYCQNFEFFLPENISKYIESSEFSAENVFREEFVQDTNLTGQDQGFMDSTGIHKPGLGIFDRGACTFTHI